MAKIRNALLLLLLIIVTSTSIAYAKPLGVLIRETDSDPTGYAYQIVVDNNALSLSGGVATIDLSGAAGGQAITFDIGDDGGDDSVDVGEIATSGDINSIFTESSADKILIDLSNNWPGADSADTLSTALTHELGGLEADVSAYTGIIAISGGSTSEVDALAELNAQIADATLLDDGAIADSTAIGLTTGDNYTNYGDAADDSLNELFEAIDAAITAGDAFTVKVDAGATAGYIGAANNDGVLRTDGTIVTYADGGNYITIGLHDYLDDIAGITAAQGDVIYFDGTDWVNLGPGTSGYYLKTQGAAANPMWDAPPGGGDITAVGDCASGDCYTDGGDDSLTLIFEGTDNAYETRLIAADPAADATVNLANEAGTLVLGPAGFGTDNILVKTNGTGQLTQATGISVDDSNNVSSVGTLGCGAITSTGVATATGFTIGSAAILEAELEIIDGATLGTADINIIDGIADSGTLTAAELLYVDGVTSAIQTQLDARCLESVTGDAIEADDLELSGTTLQLVAEIPHLDAAQNISADWETQDNIAESIGNDNDWERTYDTDISDNDDDWATALTGAGLVYETTNAAADAKVILNNADGTYGVELYVKDIVYSGALTYDGSGDSYLEMSNNASIVGSGYQIFFEAGNLISVENGTEKELLNVADGATLTGTSWDFSSVTNLVLPTTAADASGEISMSTGNQLKWHDGTKVVTIDTTPTDDNYVLKYDNASATFTLEADETGGTPAWSTVTDPTLDVTIDHDAGEETNFTFTGNYTTGSQFLVRQLTGNPTGGVLFEVRGADSDSTVFEGGDGTNVWTISTAGLLTNAGTATLNLAAASDLTVGGGQIDYDDMAGGVAVTSSGQDLGSTTAEFDDLFLNDGGKIQLGLDQDVTLTHVADTGVQMELDDSIMFGDTAVFIESDDDGYLDLDADTGIRLNAAVVGSSTITATTNVVIGDAGNIGSASDTDAIAIAANGVVTFSQDVVLAADSIVTADIATDAVTMDAVDADGNFTSLTGNWATTGYQLSGVYVSSKTAATYTIGTDLAVEVYGGIFINGDDDAIAFTLPAAVAGMSVLVANGDGVTAAITIDCDGSDEFVIDGVGAGNGNQLDSTGAAGDQITVVAISATQWLVTGYVGTWGAP